MNLCRTNFLNTFAEKNCKNFAILTYINIFDTKRDHAIVFQEERHFHCRKLAQNNDHNVDTRPVFKQRVRKLQSRDYKVETATLHTR
jgi:hypothetical protein